MDTKTPHIPLKHQERKEQPSRKQNKSPEPVSLPPLTPLPNCNRRQHHQKPKNCDISAPWAKAPPCVSRNCDPQKRRPYRVLHIGATPLMHACQQADRSRVLRLLKEQEETIGYRDRALRSALHYCMDAGTGGAVASAAPELVNAPDAEGHTPLHLAVIAGDTQLVAVLLANGADVNAKDLEGHSVLHWATVCGEAECVRLVLAAGGHPSTPDLRGGSPLHYAAQCCGAAVTAELSVPKKIGLKVLQTLLEFGADVNAKDDDGRQPILWAASAGSVEAVLALARAGGAAAAGATDKDGLTALHCAASRGHTRCVEALVNLCGCHPDHVDDNGCSALHYAATLGHADATALLLKLGADPNRQDRKGRTPALCAAAKGQLETLKILAQHGGSLHARTIRGTGVAHEAVLSGRIELIEWLAKKRPSTLDVATHDGKTPLHVAALQGYLDVCKVLLDHGARINAVLRSSKSGPMTALDAALYRGHRDCAKLVQLHGGMTAQHLRTHKSAQNRVFAVKSRLKNADSSTESEQSSVDRGPHRARRDGDVYFEERWIEKRTRRRGGASPRKMGEYRRGSRSYSEEEIRLGKSSKSRGDRGGGRDGCARRARSESSRYECPNIVESRESKTCSKKYEKRLHEYGDSSSESANGLSFGENKTSRSKRKSNGKGRGSSEDLSDASADGEPSLSDDSLEVVVVKKSLERTSEKFQISGKKSKTPRETSKETRITENRRSRKKSKTPKSNVKEIEDSDEGKSRRRSKKRDSGEVGATADICDSQEIRKMVDKRKRNKDSHHREKETTDSTSQGTIERVTVTAQVHKHQAPETPKISDEIRRESAAKSKEDEAVDKMAEKFDESPIVKNAMDEILEKADEMQSALLAKVADLRKDVHDIRRQVSGNAQEQDGGQEVKTTADDAEETSEPSDDPETVKVAPIEKRTSETTSEDSQVESSRLSSQQKDGGTSAESSEREKHAEQSSGEPDNATKDGERPRKNSKTPSQQGDGDDKEDSGKASLDDEKMAEGREETNVTKTRRRRSSTPKNAQQSHESTSSTSDAEKGTTSEKSEGSTPRSPTAEEKNSDDKMAPKEEAANSREKAFEKLPNSEDKPKTDEMESPERSAIPENENPEKSVDDDESGLSSAGKLRFIDGSSSGSVKSSGRSESRLRPSTGKNRGESGRPTSKSPSKRSLFESSEDRSPDRSAIVAVIESPEWDEEDDEEIEKELRDAIGQDADDPDSEPEDSLGVLRVLPSTSEEERTPRVAGKLLRTPKTDPLPKVDGRPRIKNADSPSGLREIRTGHAKQRRDSGGRDSGIEPSPRVSKIPKRTRYCPNSEKQQALNMETVTRDVQITLRRYQLERKIFFQLMELKRLQIRHGRANEHVLVKRQVETFHKAGMAGPTLGVAKYDQPLTFRHFEAFLYEQLRRLQRRPVTPDYCTEAKQCTQKTHRCHHATSAYTSVPVYTYLGGGGQDREEGLLPRIESRGRGQMTVEVTRGEEKQVIALPAETLDRTKRYYVTFTVRGEQANELSGGLREMGNNNAQRNTKSV